MSKSLASGAGSGRGTSSGTSGAASRGRASQGILQYLAVSCPHLVWASFGSWLRTVRPGIPPSELVTAAALRNSMPDFLAERHTAPLFKKFLQERIDADNYEALRLTG
jgi:hypothetical protein